MDTFMRYYMQGRVTVHTPSGNTYVFVTRHNICGAMVAPEDVEFIKNKRGGCCGQRRPGVFRVGSERERIAWSE